MASNDNIITNFSNATVIDGTLKVSNNILFSDRKQLSEGVYSVMNQVAPIVSSVNEKTGYVAVVNNDKYDIFYNGSKVKEVKPVSMKVDDIANKLLDQYSSQYGGNLDIFTKKLSKDITTTESDTAALSLSDTDWNKSVSNKQSGGSNMTSTPNTDMELLNNLNLALIASTQNQTETDMSLNTTHETPQTADLLHKLPAMLKKDTTLSSSELLLTNTETLNNTQRGGAYKNMKMDSHTPDIDMGSFKKMANLTSKYDKNVVSSVSSMSLGTSAQKGGYTNMGMNMDPSMMQTPQTPDLLNKLPGMVNGMNNVGMNTTGMNSTEIMFSEAMSATNSANSARSNYVDIVLNQ